jgi:HNH endonuclease
MGNATCEQCGKTYQPKYPPRKDRPPQRFCSLSCWATARNKARSGGRPRSRAGSRAASRRRRLLHQATWDGIDDEQIYERDHWKCWLCKKRIDKTYKYPHPQSASIDHVVPLSRGGTDTALNKLAAHLTCNVSRNSGKPGEQLTFNYGVDPAAIRVRIRKPPKPRKPRQLICRICGQAKQPGTCPLHVPIYVIMCRRCPAITISPTRRGWTCPQCQVCRVDGCIGTVLGKRLCPAHLFRLQRHGDVLAHIPVQGTGNPGGLRLKLSSR